MLGWSFVLGVIIGSLVPGPALEHVVHVNDKVLHASTYFALMVWFGGFYRPGLYLAIAGVLVALGVSLDLLQGLTQTRSFDLYDIAMNTAGVTVGLILSFALSGGWCQRVEQRLLS